MLVSGPAKWAWKGTSSVNAGQQEMTALVVDSRPPLDNGFWNHKAIPGVVHVLVDAQPPIYVAHGFFLDRDHWLVRGMRLPVAIDPAAPENFEIRWEQVPSIEQRVAAGDPTLADPLGTKKRTMQALIASGAAGGAQAALQEARSKPLAFTRGTVDRPEMRAAYIEAQMLDVQLGGWDAVVGQFNQMVQDAAQAPTPAGKVRAVAVEATSAATLKVQADNDGQGASHINFERHGKHDRVLAINVPGQIPYAVFKKDLDIRPGKAGTLHGGMPALISVADPADVEILWDEMISSKQATRQAKAAARQHNADPMPAAMAQAEQWRQQQGVAAPPTSGAPVDWQAVAAQNAKATLAKVTDPQMRQTLIAQYRAAGVQIDEDS
jgi:hypothetical protein